MMRGRSVGGRAIVSPTLGGKRAMTSSKHRTQLLELYDRLLEVYWHILNKAEVNRYESIGMQFIRLFQLGHWRYYWRSGRQFLKNPNTLKQELVGGEELLKELKSLTDNEIESLVTMNKVNLERLYRRSITRWLLYLLKGTPFAGVIYLVIRFSIEDILANNQVVFGIAYGLFIIVLLCSLNFLMLITRMGFVRAFGDLLQIEQARRKLRVQSA